VAESVTAQQYRRQLATVVAVDAVGFSRLMSENEEAAVAAFERRRDLFIACCEALGGRTFGAAGDSIMGEFGTPADALRAIADFQSKVAALNITDDPRMRLAFRAGINTGDVIVRGTHLYGDDVNIAARVQEFAPENGFAVSETTWHHVKDVTDTAFSDLGEIRLKNIPFPVRILVSGSNGCGSGTRRREEPFPTVGPPAIAVLPFRCEPPLAFMADGVAEDILHGLSNTRWLSVIAKGSSFQFRDESAGLRFIGQALGARYLVSGALMRSGERLRIDVSLADSSEGRLIWSRRFEHELAGIIELQTEIGGEIVSMLEKELDRVEQARTFRVPWESLETWQLIRRGRWHLSRRTREDVLEALRFFEAAFREDPGSSAVLNELAWWWFWRAWLRFGDREDLEKVERFAGQALVMDSTDARSHAYLGVCDIMRAEPKAAIDHLAEALHFNPSFAFARSAMGSARLLSGEAEAAIPFFRSAERLSPFDLYGFHNLGELAAAASLAGDWAQALTAADRSLNLSPGYFYARVLKVGALGRLGRSVEASREKAAFRVRHPTFSPDQMRWIPFADKSINEALIDNFEAVA
jgi:TolB-like protein/class 3 adenylate cyclase